MQNYLTSECRSKFACIMPNAREMATIVIPVSIRDAFPVETLGGVSGANGT